MILLVVQGVLDCIAKTKVRGPRLGTAVQFGAAMSVILDTGSKLCREGVL